MVSRQSNPPLTGKSAFSLAGETALITGGGSGIGLGIATCFVEAGAKVVLVGRRADALKAACKTLGRRASFFVHDVKQADGADELVKNVSARVGPISILANNAGNHLKKWAIDTTPQEFAHVLQTHLVGAFALTRAVLPGMIHRKRGSIVFTASMASVFGIPQLIAYAAAKSGYLGMVRTLAVEVSPHGVRVNAVAPGWIDSDMVRKAMDGDPARRAKVLGRTPMNTFGDAADVGWAVTYLCSPAARFVTGVVLPVDGGISIGF
jgi:gluconate 5-dehydrogenase